MKMLVAALLVLAASVLVTPVSSSGQTADGETLAGSLQRLEKTLTRYGSRSVGGVIRRFDAKEFRGCKITYELTPQVAPDHKGFVPSIERITIDLSKLDQSSVVAKRQKGASSVSFTTRNDERTIEHSLASDAHLFGDTSRSHAGYFFLTNKAGAEDVRTALVRAIELCRK
jgi:hypothetical protein